MHVLSADGISASVEGRTLFEGLSFGLTDDDHVGLVGSNGSGKSTLLRILAGRREPDSGRVSVNSAARISYLPQEASLDPEVVALEAVVTDAGVRRRVQSDPSLRDDPLALEVAAVAVLDRLGIADVRTAVGALSGGMRRRVALAAALVGEADLLVLDEPTNHLDAATVEWLEAELRRRRGGLLLVTHDRYFLERLCTRMLELDAGALYRHEGRYSDVLEARARRAEGREASEARRRNLLRKEVAWLRRGAKARTSKPKFRLEQAQALIEAEPSPERGQLQLGTGRRRLGKDVFELADVAVRYDGREVLRNVDMLVGPGERIGIVGPNGAGKTTLLNVLAGERVPDAGQVRVGATVEAGYYRQDLTVDESPARAIDVVREVAEWVPLADGRKLSATALMERFLFDDALAHRRVDLLSGGERRRLALCRLLMTAPNVLLLDEPTNDLDLDTLAALEDHLDTFRGTIVVASHDRYLLDRLTDGFYGIEPDGTVCRYAGDWSSYWEAQAEAQRRRGSSRAETAAKPGRQPRGTGSKPSYKDVRELAQLEHRMPLLELRRDELTAELAGAASDHVRLVELSAALEAVQRELDLAESRWLELSE